MNSPLQYTPPENPNDYEAISKQIAAFMEEANNPNVDQRILELTYERDEARAEAELWRHRWRNGHKMGMIISETLPWEE